MINITERANRVLERKFFGGKKKSPIRIFREKGACCGKGFNIKPDEPTDVDITMEVDGFTFIMEKSLHNVANEFKLDYLAVGHQTGFEVVPKETVLFSGCAGCS